MKQELLGYLKNVIDLEKSIYTQERMLKSIENQISQLGYYNSYSKPNPPQDVDGDFTTTGGLAILGAIIGGVVGLFGAGSLISLLIKWPLIGAVIGAILGFIVDMLNNSSKNDVSRRAYEQQLQNYDRAVKQDQYRVSEELKRKQRLQEISFLLKEKIYKTRSILEQYYDKNIIFPKYRNLVSICSFYEYFSSGRCTDFTGPQGAYNIFEQERRLDNIVTKLDQVLIKLDEISENQYILHETILEGNRISQQLLTQSNKQIQLAEYAVNNSAISAYCAQENLNETKQMKWLVHHDLWCMQNNIDIL